GDHRLLVLLEDLGADRDTQHDILPAGAGALRAHAVPAGPGEEMLLEAEVDQRVQPIHRLGPDIAALAAVAAVRPAIFDEFLAAEGHAARAPAARADIDLGEIEKFHGAASL